MSMMAAMMTYNIFRFLYGVCGEGYSYVRALRDRYVKRSVTDLAAGAAKR